MPKRKPMPKPKQIDEPKSKNEPKTFGKYTKSEIIDMLEKVAKLNDENVKLLK